MNILSKLNKSKKDRNFKFNIYNLTYDGKGIIQIFINIFGFESLLNKFLADPTYQMFWNDIKERYGKDIDEQELYKVFKFYVLIIIFTQSLNHAMESLLPHNIISNNRWYYNIYRNKDFFDGKLDEKTFKELVIKITEYLTDDFYEKYNQYKEQKDEQPK